MDIIIDYDGNEIITKETCSICLEDLNDLNDIHELNECKHKFHSKCLITYLRTGNSSCPLCRGNSNEILMKLCILIHLLVMIIILLFQLL